MLFVEIVEDWTGWCPRKDRALMASGTGFLSGEISMKTQKGISSRTKGIAAIILLFVAAVVGMRLEFGGLQSFDWFMADSKAVEGCQWLANNTEKDATVLAWWDYADGIKNIGHRGVVINEASRNIQNTIGGYADPSKPWHKIEYALWYPYEPDENVKDVADFFLSESVASAKEIALKCKANYALVMSDDLVKYFSVVMASGKNFSDYMRIPTDYSSPITDIRPYLKKETIFTRMVNGDNIEGFTKVFDNEMMRIYKLA